MENKVLVTGANGLVGQKLLQKMYEENGKCLLEQQLPKWEICAISRGNSRLPSALEATLEYKSIDITEFDKLSAYVLATEPQWIVHAAATTKVDDGELYPEKTQLTNVAATEHLVRLAEKVNAFFLYLSTDFVFSGEGDGLYSEEDEPNPINFYGKTKWEAEKIVRNSKTSWAIVRTCLVYGTNFQLNRSNIVLWVINNLRQGNPIRVVADQWRTPTLVEDLAQGCLAILDRQAKGIFHLAGKDFLRPYDLAHLTAQVFELDARLISPTDASQFKEIGKRPLKTGLDISKAQAELDYSPRSVLEGLQLMKEQFKNF